MNAITQPEVNALTVSKESAYGLLMDSNAMDRMERIADLMASGRTTVPQHIRGSKGAESPIACKALTRFPADTI